MSHTPGPWKIEHAPTSLEIVGERYVASVYNWSLEYSAYKETNKALNEEAIGNANLISAAPELLLAIKECIEVLGDYEAELNEPKGTLRYKLESLVKKTEGKE